jgi:hypothetical protein
VWHELTQAARAEGRLAVVAIAQEQHPERCRLFAQWKDFDFTILWDPFNATGSKVVPNVVAVDEHGIVRKVDPDPKTFEVEFLSVTFPAPAGPIPATPLDAGEKPTGEPDGLVERSERALADAVAPAEAFFRAGVARRLRYDSRRGRAEDFQKALDYWARALALDPDQYIWRRRIQQYGPRMDKPYPFYDWVEEAREAIRARGETPVELVADLTPAERASKSAFAPAADEGEPDPGAKISRDERDLVVVEHAVAFDTSAKEPAASLHLAFRPSAARAAHFDPEAGPITVWIGSPSLPGGVEVSPRKLTLETATGGRAVRASVDLRIRPGAEVTELRGYALAYVCEGADGVCRYLRHDFRVPIRIP